MKRLTIVMGMLLVTGCGKTETPEAEPGATTAAAGTGTVIEVRAITDEKGNRFEPAKIEAHTGDVLRFTLVSGVHNVSFPPTGNPAGATLPPAGDMLQLPGQTYDLSVSLPAGTYHFQCDPHAALGMAGELEVE